MAKMGIIDKKSKELYEFIISGRKPSVSALLEAGFTSEDITNFVGDGQLTLNEQQEYTFTDVAGLYFYAKSYLRFQKQKDCFLLCSTLDPTFNDDKYFSLFMGLKKRDYVSALREAKKLIDVNYRDMYLIMTLLAYVSYLSDDDLNIVRGVLVYDYLYKKPENDIQRAKNKVASLVFHHEFKKALTLQGKLADLAPAEINRGSCIRFLLNDAIDRKKIKRENIANLFHSGRHEELVKYLENEEACHGIDVVDRQVLLLVRDLLKMKETAVVPEVIDGPKRDVYEAIAMYDYELALNFVLGYKNNGDTEVSLLLEEMLQEVVALIGQLDKTRKINPRPVEKNPADRTIHSLREILDLVFYHGYSVKDACRKCYLGREQMAIVTLLFAKEYAKLGETDLALSVARGVDALCIPCKTVWQMIREVEELTVEKKEENSFGRILKTLDANVVLK